MPSLQMHGYTCHLSALSSPRTDCVQHHSVPGIVRFSTHSLRSHVDHRTSPLYHVTHAPVANYPALYYHITPHACIPHTATSPPQQRAPWRAPSSSHAPPITCTISRCMHAMVMSLKHHHPNEVMSATSAMHPCSAHVPLMICPPKY